MDNHYNPQFYLRQWTGADGRLIYYRRTPTGTIAEAPIAPKGTSYEPDLYATPSALDWEHYDPDLIEKTVMQPIDDGASNVLKKLVSGTSLTLSAGDRRAWATFLNSLLHRHRDGIIERDELSGSVASDAVGRFLGRYPNPADRQRAARSLGTARVEQMAKNAHRSVMVAAIRNPSAIEFIENLAWDVIVLQPTLPTITTDRPLLVNLGEPGSIQIMTMALSPTRLFVAYPSFWRTENYAGEVADLFETVALAHDLLLLNEQRCRFVYSSQRLQNDIAVGGKIVHLQQAVKQALQRWAW